MTKTEMLKRRDAVHTAGFDHPCRETCSGWQQGHDRGYDQALALCEKENQKLRDLLRECFTELRAANGRLCELECFHQLPGSVNHTHDCDCWSQLLHEITAKLGEGET